MLKKFFIVMMVISVSLFGINLNTASKEELMSIKGIGIKKADMILKFRKTHKIKSVDDLRSLKGFGDVLISNIKNNVKNKPSAKKNTLSKNNKVSKDSRKTNNSNDITSNKKKELPKNIKDSKGKKSTKKDKNKSKSKSTKEKKSKKKTKNKQSSKKKLINNDK